MWSGIIIIIIIIIIITSWEFFTSALADGLSVEFEWQQVSSSLQDSSQYSSRSKKSVVWMESILPPISDYFNLFPIFWGPFQVHLLLLLLLLLLLFIHSFIHCEFSHQS